MSPDCSRPRPGSQQNSGPALTQYWARGGNQPAPTSPRRGEVGEADAYRAALVKFYGEEKGKRVRYAEAFEVCEYGRRPTFEELKKLFPIGQ